MEIPPEFGFFEFFGSNCEEIGGYEVTPGGDYWAYGARRVD